MDRAEIIAAPSHLGYLLISIGRVLREDTRERIKTLGLDPNHIGVLSVLESSGRLSQRELGRILRTDRTTIVRFIDELQTIGLVARESSEDRRINSLSLTEAGKTVAEQMERLVLEAERAVFSKLSAKERLLLKSMLERVHRALPTFET